MKSFSESYKAAGVDVTAGYKSVELMKKHVARTTIPGVVSGIGGFGGLFQLGFQPVDLPGLLLKLILQLCLGFGFLQLKGGVLFPLKLRFPLLEFPLELLVPHLLDNGGIAGLVHLEHLAAFGAFDFIHSNSSKQVKSLFAAALHRNHALHLAQFLHDPL